MMKCTPMKYIIVGTISSHIFQKRKKNEVTILKKNVLSYNIGSMIRAHVTDS